MTVGKKALDFDKVLEHIGPLGKWQWVQSLCMLMVGACAGIGAVTFAFTAYEPNYRCVMPECNESISNGSYHTLESVAALSVMFPTKSIEEAGRQCYRFSGANQCGNYSRLQPKERCSNSELIFDTRVVSSSIVQDLNMLCDQAYQKSIFSSLYTVGVLLGSFVIGVTSDTFGRKPAMMLSIACIGFSGVIKVFTTNKIVFAILRVFHGIGGKGCALVAYVASAECSLPRYKVLLMFIAGMGFQLGEFLYAVEAYFLRDWITLQLAVHIPILFLIFLYFVVPESGRWLISQGKSEEAKKILIRRAKINNFGPIPDHIFESDDESKTVANKNRLTFWQTLLAISKSSHSMIVYHSIPYLLQ